MPGAVLGPLELEMARRTSSPLSGDRPAPGVGQGTEIAQLRPYQPGDDVRRLDPRRPPARASPTCACRCPSAS